MRHRLRNTTGTCCIGDGGGTTGTLTPFHTYADDGSFTTTVTVTNSGGLSATDTALVTVNNVPPTVDAGSNQTVFPTETISLAPATFTDPGSADTHTATIDWGSGTVVSGTVGSGTVAGGHTYSTTGTYSVTVTVLDDDGGVGSDTFTVNVFRTSQARWKILLPLVLNKAKDEGGGRLAYTAAVGVEEALNDSCHTAQTKARRKAGPLTVF